MLKNGIKRFIDIHVPITVCNLKCHYCYVGQNKLVNSEKTIFMYSPEIVKKALSVERLGGICHFNVCGLGETLMPKELFNYIKVILENGHYVMIVTNGLLSDRFDEYTSSLDEILLKRLGFKFSYHYLELKRTNQFDKFFENINKVRSAGCSYSLELTPNDELEPYIDDIKNKALENVGALCHVTVPRNENDNRISILTKHNKEEFMNIWSTFNSKMFDFKMRHWQEKRTEYCYAGLWSGTLDIGLGTFSPCYCQRGYSQNIFDDVNKPIQFLAVGKCKVAHCYNSHSFLTLGVIPEINEEHYIDMRQRKLADNTNWLNDDMAAFLNTRLEDNNSTLNDSEKIVNYINRKKIFVKNALKKCKSKIIK